MANDMPFTPKMIGQVIVVQAFKRSTSEPGQLETESLTKHVGKLQSYMADKDYVRFRFEGGAVFAAFFKDVYIEAFVK